MRERERGGREGSERDKREKVKGRRVMEKVKKMREGKKSERE